MTLNRAATADATSAECPCGCFARERKYTTDLTGQEWAVLEPLLPPPACLAAPGGRPEKHYRRAIISAIFYIADNGCKWRNLPADFLSVTWNQASHNPSRILRRHHELRRPVGHEVAGREVAGSGPA
jgi:transposase